MASFGSGGGARQACLVEALAKTEDNAKILTQPLNFRLSLRELPDLHGAAAPAFAKLRQGLVAKSDKVDNLSLSTSPGVVRSTETDFGHCGLSATISPEYAEKPQLRTQVAQGLSIVNGCMDKGRNGLCSCGPDGDSQHSA